VSFDALAVAAAPAIIDLKILSFNPAQLLQTLTKRGEPPL